MWGARMGASFESVFARAQNLAMKRLFDLKDLGKLKGFMFPYLGQKDSTLKFTNLDTQPSIKGPEEWFTGTVRIDPLNFPPEPARVSVASVTFEPGARTAWHTHPLGQTLIVIAGCGWTQCEGEPIVEIRAGDVIWCPPGHKHWHGVTATTSMTHIAVQEALKG
jgi:quercetin dioxygenase-like cupin family protein